ncbi:MAG: Fe-S protein assembly co-chaperone HscB [Rhodospirillales bacterium]|nr:Fe-S protein assembly co-chaperone HscB [Rhodospirillales bacterium]
MNDVAHKITGAGQPDGIVACWSCNGPIAADALFCNTCWAVQPPRPMDHFARLGLDIRFAIDTAELDRRYFARQRQLHPDRFATRTPRERAISQNQAVCLNEAYEALKDPLSRATYLLKLRGIDTNPDGCNTIKDPTLLMEQMELREGLAAADTREAATQMLREAEAHVNQSLAHIGGAFAAGDLDTAGRETTRLKYLVKLVDEARTRRACFAPAAAAPAQS